MRFAIRGIYSTALIKVLLDGGFELTNPTRSQRERFGAEDRGEADILIQENLRNRHYVELRGLREAVDEAVEHITKRIGDTLVLRRDDGDLARARIGFPAHSKKILDEVRSEVAYTVPWHHYCRAGGEALSTLVSFAEDLVEQGVASEGDVSRLFEEMVARMSPRRGVVVKILHDKPDGTTLKLRPGKTVWRGSGEVKIQRRIMGGGSYDGLNVPKSPGDYAITEAKLMEWYTKTRYFDISGNLKGTYYNVCTPVALYPDHIHYFDLEVDVVVYPDSRSEIIDAEKLENAVEEGRIPRGLGEKALRKAEELAEKQP